MKVSLIRSVALFASVACTFSTMAQTSPNKPLWQTEVYQLFPDSIVQENKLVAKALSATEMVSNYQSPANAYQSAIISFKFSINGKDNEMKPGVNHQFFCTGTNNTTPLITFGEPLKEFNTNAAQPFLLPDTKLTIKVDFTPVINEFNSKGYYTTINGDKIYKEDFKGLYIAGGTAPLMWDFDNLANKEALSLKDADGDGIYETTLLLNSKIEEKNTAATWKQEKNIEDYSQYQSEHSIANAIYNMSMEEMIKAVEPDSTFRTGKEWAGVWTRDISYSIILSMAHLQPRVAMNSLLKKVNAKRKIIQDTGTGGAYPVSSDRMIWAVAAWEVYKVTGDEAWLKNAYEIISNSIEDDLLNVYDATSGLVKGESSFLDWREQTYPKWMQPADIYASKNLGTNAVHYQANVVAAEMAKLLNKPTEALKYTQLAAKIKTAINQNFWLADKGYYGQFIYGRLNPILSPKSEALGEALCVLFGIANTQQQQSVITKTPVMQYGIPCVYPQIPNISPYHNNAVWPFVQAYWALAAAKVGNETSVMHSVGSIYRAAAMFLTNKENLVAENGDFAGTQINSSNMLWSLSGNIALVHKLLFGIQYHPSKITFQPFVPQALKGKRSLLKYIYRNAILNIHLEGYGNTIASFQIDGVKKNVFEIPATLTGVHEVHMLLQSQPLPNTTIHLAKPAATPATPIAYYKNNVLKWSSVAEAAQYQILRNGILYAISVRNNLPVTETAATEYQVIAVDNFKTPSFASEPVMAGEDKWTQTYQLEQYAAPANLPLKGFSGSGFVATSLQQNTSINIPVTIDQPGKYALSFRYANGHGPINTSNKCAFRTLLKNDTPLGVMVFPQRGNEEWSNWGWSNSIVVKLEKGIHHFVLKYFPQNANMHEVTNEAMLDFLQIRKIE